MASQGMWDRFRERTLPRMVGWIQEAVGREVPVEIDWYSLGEEHGSDESLEYDLEMLARGLAGPGPMTGPPDEELRGRICEGIQRIRIRQVTRLADCRLEVFGGTLRVEFSWLAGGSFSAADVRALLLDRDKRRLAQWVTAPTTGVGEQLQEVWRNRMPAIHASLEDALGRSLPVRIDWPSLRQAPDPGVRLVHMLKELISALRSLARRDPGMVVGPEQVRRRADQRAAQRCESVEQAVGAIEVGGALAAEEDVVRLDPGVLRLFVHQDATYARPDGRAVSEIRRFPGCTSRDIEAVLSDQLDLEVAPLLRQVREEDFPKARAHLPKLLRQLVNDSVRGVRARVEMNEQLARAPIELEVDWPGLTAPEASEDRLTSLRMLETGPYNYNCDFGELFRNLFYALGDAAREAPEFVPRLVRRVRKIRYEAIADPAGKELVADGATLVVRQCLYRPGGTLGDSDGLTRDLIVTVAAMGDAGFPSADGPAPTTQAGGEIVRSHLGRLVDALGPDFSASADQALLAGPQDVERLRQRVLTPLVGAVLSLLDRDGCDDILRRDLQRVVIRHVPTSAERACSYDDGTLELHCCPEAGAPGCLAGDELVDAIDDALALRVRAEIGRLERDNRPSWQRMLRERFDREVRVDVDWASFLAHPTEGGNRLYALYVVEAGVMRLIYALTGWMDDDDRFRAGARRCIAALRVTCAPDADAKDLLAEGQTITYRCFPEAGLRGYLTIDELQQRLYRLVPTRGGDPRRDKA